MSSFADTLKQLGATRLSIMGGILVVLLLFFVFISVRLSTPSMKLLYADLSTEDSGAIAAKLEETGIAYDISTDGSRIIADGSQIGRARMLLAESGLPNGGNMGYEIFDQQSGFGTTNFVQNISKLRALEGELARTISDLGTVKSARVHLVLPQRELFSRENRQASASVFIGVRPGAQVGRNEILAIQSLVSSAVPDLKSSDVSIIDSNGNLLAKRDDGEGASFMSMKAEEMRLNTERNLAEKIEDQVSRVVGYGKVRATVTVEMNFDQISTNEELYDPEGSVLRSSQVVEENETERDNASNQNVSVENNLPGIDENLLNGQSPSLESNRIEEVSNYEISKTIRSTVRESGDIERISVAVLVDGRTITSEEGEKTYEPWSEDQLSKINTLVKSTIGFDDMRGDTVEVINMEFAEVDTNEEFVDDRLLLGFEKDKLVEIAGMITVAIMMILVILLVLQPMVKTLLMSESNTPEDPVTPDLLTASTANPALAPPQVDADGTIIQNMDDEEDTSLVDIQGVDGKIKKSTIKKVENIVANHPGESVAVIRSWMTEEG